MSTKPKWFELKAPVRVAYINVERAGCDCDSDDENGDDRTHKEPHLWHLSVLLGAGGNTYRDYADLTPEDARKVAAELTKQADWCDERNKAILAKEPK